MTLMHDPCVDDCAARPAAARPAAAHTLVPDIDGDGYESPHSEHWACSCGHVVSSWVQSEPACTDRPELECVLAAHATHVAVQREPLLDALAAAVAWIEDLADGGPDVRVTSPIKILEEAAELSEAPDDIEEAADVAIALTALCLNQRFTQRDLAAAIEKKVTKNLGRTWYMVNGAWQHVSTPEDP